jgi:DUF4097 and DUF4098 domain-containing protein YvlB
MGALMPRFDTPEPITLELDLNVADVRIEAGDRTDTLVEVRPANQTEEDDVSAAERTRVESVPGRVVVRTPRSWRAYSPFSHGGAVDVHVELPAGSHVTAKSAMGAVRAIGTLGETHIKVGYGDIDVERAATVRLTTGAGDVAVGDVAGAADLSTGTGEIRAGGLHGPAVIKNGTGDIHVGAAAAGPVNARTGFGQIEVGVPDGIAAWLDLATGYGQVRNDLDRAGPPEPSEAKVEVRAKSGYGDITINRAYPGAD